MTLITLNLTVEEVQLLAALASEQLFRREFIDCKMPGYRSNSDEMRVGKALVARMKLMLDPYSEKKNVATRMTV
jgi:hypothetical protein